MGSKKKDVFSMCLFIWFKSDIRSLGIWKVLERSYVFMVEWKVRFGGFVFYVKDNGVVFFGLYKLYCWMWVVFDVF